MKLLMTADSVGGVWQYATGLARGLSRLGIDTVLALLGPPPTSEQRMAAERIDGLTLIDTGLPLEWLAEAPEEVRSAARRLAGLAGSSGADVVQLNAPALAAGVDFPCPVVAVAHSCVGTWWRAVKEGEPVGDFRWRSALTGEGLAVADRMVAPSAAFAQAVREVQNLAALPEVVHNGRDPVTAPPLASHDFAFTAGRLWDEGKNVATLDRAAARLPVPLYAAGPMLGPNGAAIELEHAHALGALSDAQVDRWLAARPVFVSAARYEPFGLAVLEAASAGCPLVLSDIPTFRELWSGVAAFVDPTDGARFAETVRMIVEDDAARAEMGRRAKRRAAQFSVRAMAGKMAAIYRELVAPPAPVSREAMVAA